MNKGGAGYVIRCLKCGEDDREALYHGETSIRVYTRLKESVRGRGIIKRIMRYTSTIYFTMKAGRVNTASNLADSSTTS